jgi:hypothetical protein
MANRLIFLIPIFLILIAPAQASASAPSAPRSAIATGAFPYSDSHPRLLFTPDELPALQQKVRDGGRDDGAYAAVRETVAGYFTKPVPDLFEDGTFGIDVVSNTGIAAYLETPRDPDAMVLGRSATLYVVDAHDPEENDDPFYTSLRMRTLAFGYDMFFGGAPDSIRTLVRNEVLEYVDSAMIGLRCKRWLWNPYVSNKSAMIGAALGLAALCLEDEMPHEQFLLAIEKADEFVRAWHESLLDPGGSYHEGAMYAGWSMQNLAYYFWARKRLHDRFDYSALEKIRNLEKWIAFSILPVGDAAVNNVNDTAYLNYPFSREHTYFDWAQTAWGSGLSSWLWERFVGSEFGHDSGALADRVATVLWDRNLPPTNPRAVLPQKCLWRQHGFYYFRTGWPEGRDSDDVVFSFYSGKFKGGHAQEDQNNFTLYGFGAVFAADNGFGLAAKESEAHNVVLIDDNGEHNAGSSVGTDGGMSEFILSGFADYILGDATAAYSTYSEYNRPGYPFPDDDWSWGYKGANPVEYAHRRVITIHDRTLPPYFILADDIRKDSGTHRYSWRLHTREDNSIDITENPIRIEGGRGAMELLVMGPPVDSLDAALVPFDNGSDDPDPNTTVISLTRLDTTLEFCCLMLPRGNSDARPAVFHDQHAWGSAAALAWPGDVEDLVIYNPKGALVDFRAGTVAGDTTGVETDARIIDCRWKGSALQGLVAINVSRFVFGRAEYVVVDDGKVNLAISDDTVYVDRRIRDFRFYMPRGGVVRCDESTIPTLLDRGYLVPDLSGRPAPAGGIGLRAFPNPFNPTANIVVDVEREETVVVRIYDVGGRLVTTLWSDSLPKGANILRWEGIDASAQAVASGVYLVTAQTAGGAASIKVVLVR